MYGTIDRVKTAYKCQSMEPENVAFMSSYCPLYIGWNYVHHSLMGKMRQWFVL